MGVMRKFWVEGARLRREKRHTHGLYKKEGRSLPSPTAYIQKLSIVVGAIVKKLFFLWLCHSGLFRFSTFGISFVSFSSLFQFVLEQETSIFSNIIFAVRTVFCSRFKFPDWNCLNTGESYKISSGNPRFDVDDPVGVVNFYEPLGKFTCLVYVRYY